MGRVNAKFASRKFLLTAGVQLFSSVALAWGWLSGGEYMQISMMTVGAYNAANFGGDFMRAKGAA